MVRRVVKNVVRAVTVATALSVGLFVTAGEVVVDAVRRVVPSKKAKVTKKVAARKSTRSCRGKKCNKPCGKRGQVVEFRRRSR